MPTRMIGRHGTATSVASSVGPWSRGQERPERDDQRDDADQRGDLDRHLGGRAARSRRRSRRRGSRRRGTTAGSAGRSGARGRPPACWCWRPRCPARRRTRRCRRRTRPWSAPGTARGPRRRSPAGRTRSSSALSSRFASVSATTEPTPASRIIISRISDSVTSDRCHLSWKSGSRVVRLSRISPWVRKPAAVAARARELRMAGIVACRATRCPRSSPETGARVCSVRDDSPRTTDKWGMTDGTHRVYRHASARRGRWARRPSGRRPLARSGTSRSRSSARGCATGSTTACRGGRPR